MADGILWSCFYRTTLWVQSEKKSDPEHIKHGSSLNVSSLQAFIEGHKFFEQYETTFQTLKQAADIYIKSDSSGKVNQ